MKTNIPALQVVGSIAIPPSVIKHRFVREALAVATLFSQDDERIERVVGTLNNKKCELYGWATSVAAHTDKTGYVYLLPLNDGNSVIYTEDHEIHLKVGEVVRLNDFHLHWTVDEFPIVCAFVGSFKEPNDKQAMTTLQQGVTALAKGDYYDAPRVRSGFQAMLEDECFAIIDSIESPEQMLISDALVCGLWIEPCGECGEPAIKLDSYYPYFNDENKCRNHLRAD